jgi:hypothetical protein
VALLARQGIPPPSPLDPDYPLQYRYLFHALAAALQVGSGADVALVAGATSGVVAGALVLAGGALALALTRSWLVAVPAGALAALYGPSYWLQEALTLGSGGRLPGLDALAAQMGGRWSLSPLAPSFPSVLTAQGSSPGLPMGILGWFGVLLCAAGVAGGLGGRRIAVPAESSSWTTCSAALGGVLLALLAFAADFFLPLALVALLVGAAGAHRWARAGCRRRPAWARPARGAALAAALGCALGAVFLFGATRQAGGAGAAENVRLTWNAALAHTPVYGGNHALLSGGEPIPFPNWVALHDWGLLFWPGALLVLVGAWRRRDPILLAGGTAAVATAMFWHLCTVSYESRAPTDLRVQMYRYASVATASLAPLLPAGIYAAVIGGPARRQVVFAALLAPTVAVAGGAGAYLLAGVTSVAPEAPAHWAGDAVLARALAAEPGPHRLAVLRGPTSFTEMYNVHPGGYLPLWWGLGASAVPVGWDFGHPERYEPLYRRVVADLDPAAAAVLGLTHVALAPANVPPAARPALERFLARCRAELVDSWGAAEAAEARRLYRVRAASCGEA